MISGRRQGPPEEETPEAPAEEEPPTRDAGALRVRDALEELFPDAPLTMTKEKADALRAACFSGSATFSALATLGTPHAPPPEGFFRTIDQTRGLLRFVEERYPGAYHEELRYLTVGSTAQKGALPGSGAGRVAAAVVHASPFQEPTHVGGGGGWGRRWARRGER